MWLILAIEAVSLIAWQLFSLAVRELGGCSAGATSIELAGLGTLRDAEARGATTTGVGDAHRAGGTLRRMAARRDAGAVAVATTVAPVQLANALEAEAVLELIVATGREASGACTGGTYIGADCCECLAGDQGSQSCSGRDAGGCFHRATAGELPISQSLGYAFEPVCHLFLLVFTVLRV